MIALIWFVLAVLASPFKSKSRLEAENAVLRHQLIVLRRKVRRRAQLTNNDRWFLVQMWCTVLVIPAHYRLTRPHANVAAATTQIRSACGRVGSMNDTAGKSRWGNPGEVMKNLSGSWLFDRKIEGYGSMKGVATLPSACGFCALLFGRLRLHPTLGMRVADGESFLTKSKTPYRSSSSYTNRDCAPGKQLR